MPGIETGSTSVAGISVREVTVEGEPPTSIYYAAVGENVVVTTALDGIADLVSCSPRLADDRLFQEATQAAGLPRETVAFAYVDFAQGIPLAETLGALAALDPALLENLGALESLVVYATPGAETRFAGVLRVE